MSKIYIGYDYREQEAYNVCKFSIQSRNASYQTQPLVLSHLKSVIDRPIEKKDGKLWCPISQAPMSTEFAISRFCIPFLEKKGWHLFMDCDMILQTDIKELFDLVDNRYAVMVVKHKQESGGDTKMDGQVQTYYNRKNWSSFVLWNCEHPANKRFTIEDLNTWPGRDLHAFKWLNDDEIGELNPEWNYLVGVNDPIENPKNIHFTLGGPWFENWGIRYPEDILWLNESNSFKKYNNEKRESVV